MVGEAEYDYSASLPFLEPFNKWVEDTPFITELEELYGRLWQFKSIVESWTFSVNRFKDYVFLRHRVKNSEMYVNWNLNEKVALVEQHQRNFIVITLQAIDDSGEELRHTHSIVCHEDDESGVFDLDELVRSLQSASMGSLADDFHRQFHPWVRKDASSMARRTNIIFRRMEKQAMQSVERPVRGGQGRGQQRLDSQPGPQSVSAGRGRSGSSGRGQARAPAQKRKTADSGAGESSDKRRKSASQSRPTKAGSSGSALTTVQTGQRGDALPIQSFEVAAAYQKEFWDKNQDCFIFDPQTFQVSIGQCFLAREKYIIRKLEPKIVEDVKKELVHLGDAKQRQRICLTPMDANRRLLRERPKNWDAIKAGNFFIINGQHSITAAKQLQRGGVCEERKVELQTWEATIVWSLDAAKLTEISKWYNTTNHIQHSQPTWGNQIFACREIWISAKRPTNVTTEGDVRGNSAVLNPAAYAKFVQAVLIRFQSINLDKDGANVKNSTDVKNEIRMVTLNDAVYKLWEEFLTRHREGSLVDPCTRKPYSTSKTFNPANFSLKREFFKHMGHFTDKDLHEYVLHLLGRTAGRTRDYPKVSFHKTKFLCEDNMSKNDWVERRKRKKVIIEEFLAIDSSLKFKDKEGDVNDEEWRAWKAEHLFTSASWDFLLTATPNGFFVKRLKNEGKKKRAIDYEDKQFPTVYPLMKRFLRLKNKVNWTDGEVYIRGHECFPQAFCTSHNWPYQRRELPLGIIDFRQLPRPKAGSGDPAPVSPLLNFLANHMRPSLSAPQVWLWIVGSRFDADKAIAFAEKNLKQFVLKMSTYIPCKAERINNVSNRAVAPPVTLIFLFKRGADGVAVGQKSIKKEYSTSDCPYYTDSAKNNEAKYRVHHSELRMEFYIDLLQSFAVTGENVISVYSGSKFLIAAKMYGLFCYGISDRHARDKFLDMAKHGDKADLNDFLHDNSPYLASYVRPPLLGTPELNSNSSPSREVDVEVPEGQREVVGDQGESDLGIDEFGTNANVVQGVNLEVSAQDFQVLTREHAPTSGRVQESAAEASTRRKGKEPQIESIKVDIDLSDTEDTYSDLDAFKYDGPDAEQAGPSGVDHPEDPVHQSQPGLVNVTGGFAGAAAQPVVVVKEEKMDFWRERDAKKARRREEERLERERMAEIMEENRMLKEQLSSQAAVAQVPSTLQQAAGDVQNLGAPLRPRDRQFTDANAQGYLRVEDNPASLLASLVDIVSPSAVELNVASSVQGGDIQADLRVQIPSTSAVASGTKTAVGYPRAEDIANKLDVAPQSVSVLGTEEGDIVEELVPPPTASQIQVFPVESQNPPDDDDEEKVDYGGGLEDDFMNLEFDQVVATSRGDSVPRNVSSLVAQPRQKWLNVVFDLNGVLCQCVARSSIKGVKVHCVEDNVFSDREPTLIGTKAVYIRPNLREFLIEVSKTANRIVVWSSMLKKTVEPVVGFLFQNCKPPFDILGQDKCKKVERSPGNFLAEHGGPFKPLFLKVLRDHFFLDANDPTSFNEGNTLLVDDSPKKSVLNENGNAIFLESWNHYQRGDKVLLGSLAPWLKRLYEDCQLGRLREYVEANRIGVPPMAASSYRADELLDGLRESAMNFGSRYVLPGMNLVIEPERCRK